MLAILILALMIGAATRLLLAVARIAPWEFRCLVAATGTFGVLAVWLLLTVDVDVPQDPSAAFHYGAWSGALTAGVYLLGAAIAPRLVAMVERARLALTARNEPQA